MHYQGGAMRIALVTLLSLFTTTSVYAYCANSYRVAADAAELERDARSLSYEASRYGYPRLSNRALSLSTSSSFLESSARGSFGTCAQLMNNYNRVLSDYSILESTYRPGRHNQDVGFEYRQVRHALSSLRLSMSSIRYNPRVPRTRPLPRPYPPRTRPLPPRHPRTRPAPRPAPPRHRPAPPRRPGRGGPVGRPGRGGRGGRHGIDV